MSYIKQNWKTGKIISVDKLNYIENGIQENNNDIVIITSPTIELNPLQQQPSYYTINEISKSYVDIINDVRSGKKVVIKFVFQMTGQQNITMTVPIFLSFFSINEDEIENISFKNCFSESYPGYIYEYEFIMSVPSSIFSEESVGILYIKNKQLKNIQQ